MDVFVYGVSDRRRILSDSKVILAPSTDPRGQVACGV